MDAPFTALLVVAAVAAPWYYLVYDRTQGEWLRSFIFKYNLRPFEEPILSHGDVSAFDHATAIVVSILYYFYQIPAVLGGFFPWSVFLGPTLVETIRRIRGGKGSGVRGQGSEVGGQGSEDGEKNVDYLNPFFGFLLAACWFGTWFVFWSICKTKLPHYLLPAYPALALLTGCFVDRWWSEPASLPRWALRNAWISTILVGVGFTIALPIVAAVFLPGERWLGLVVWLLIAGLVGLILIGGGAWCWRETSRGRARQTVVGFAVMSVAFLTVIFGFAVLRVDRFQNARPIIAAIVADQRKGEASPLPPAPLWPSTSATASPIATLGLFRESFVHYAGHPITQCEDDEASHTSARRQLARFLAASRRSYVITTDEHVKGLHEAFPGKLQEIFRQRRFLNSGEMVVLRWGPAEAE